MKKFVTFVVLAFFAAQVLANGDTMVPPHFVKHSFTRYRSYSSSKTFYNSVTVTLVAGSLKDNIERIARDNGWPKVVWDHPNDYSWITYTKIQRPSFAGVVKAILVNYPLKATFYQGNRVLLIQSRTMR